MYVQKFEPIAKSQLKKILKMFVRESHKQPAKESAASAHDDNLEEAKNIVIKEDPSLPKAKLIKISASTENRNGRVKLFGWVHRLRRQGTLIITILYILGEISAIRHCQKFAGNFNQYQHRLIYVGEDGTLP